VPQQQRPPPIAMLDVKTKLRPILDRILDEGQERLKRPKAEIAQEGRSCPAFSHFTIIILYVVELI
jgi:hypothetical protein